MWHTLTRDHPSTHSYTSGMNAFTRQLQSITARFQFLQLTIGLGLFVCIAIFSCVQFSLFITKSR